MAATRVWASPYPFHCPSWTRSLRVTHELRERQPQWLCSEFVPSLLLFDCQEAFHCCLVVTCINRINMISIQCHRVGEWWSGKPEFENVSDPAGVYIPFNMRSCLKNLEIRGTENALKFAAWFQSQSSVSVWLYWLIDTLAVLGDWSPAWLYWVIGRQPGCIGWLVASLAVLVDWLLAYLYWLSGLVHATSRSVNLIQQCAM